MCILDLSKTLMYDFHYNYIKVKYGDNARLLMTDTDSLMYEITTKDFYKDIELDIDDKFDTSDYPRDNYLFSNNNRKIPGMFKDECNGKIIGGFVGLRPKLYSYFTVDGVESKKCKGIKQSVVKHVIHHDDYKQCLFSKHNKLVRQNVISSYQHEVYTETINKIALSAHDDKRIILDDCISTLAFGHVKLI